MKQPYLKLWHCLVFCGFLLLSTIIYSCKKDNNASWQTGQMLSQSDLTRFKEIYNSGVSQTVSYVTREAQPGSAVLNLIKSINIQWDSYTVIQRPDSATVTEFAMQPDSSTFMTKQVSKGQLITDYNKTSAVFVQKNDSVCLGFFMKVIEHIGTEQNKPLLKDVRYKQIPAGFNGQVMFYGLDRRYLTGYDYKNGTLTGVISISAKQGGSVGILSVDDTKKVMQTQVCIIYPVYEARCGVNYKLESDGSHTNPVYWCDGSIYVGSVTSCTTIDGNGGVPGDGGGGGSGPGTTPPSNDCPPVAISSIYGSKKVWKYNGPCDPVPPQPQPEPEPEPEVPAIIKNKVNDPCLHRMVNEAIARNINYNMRQSMNSIFKTNTKFNLSFEDGVIYNQDGTTSTTIDGTTGVTNPEATIMPGTNRLNIISMDVNIKLNILTLPKSSEEYVAATILHEALHAYFRATNQSQAFDHYTMVTDYIPWFEATMHAIYPNIDTSNLKALAYGGLMDRNPPFLFSSESSMIDIYSNVNERYKTALDGKKCTP